LKVSLKGKRDVEQEVTLVGRKTARIEARPEDIGTSNSGSSFKIGAGRLP